MLLLGCPRAEDPTPEIRVVPGAAARALWIRGRWGATDAGAAVAGAPARVHAMKAGEELGGPNAIGKPNDLVLENDEVVFVINALGGSAGYAESGGNIVDAADARARSDELGQVFTYFGTFPRQIVYERLTYGTTSGGVAWVLAEGKELYDPKIVAATRYTLAASDRAVLIETVLTNKGDKPTDKLTLGDAIQWGAAEKIAPGKPPGFKGASSGSFLGGLGRDVSYAITSTDGAIDAVSGSSWSDTAQKSDVVLAPSQSVQYARVFLVGERGDSSSVVAELMKTAGQEVGAVDVALVDEAGKPLTPPPGSRVVLSRNGAEVLSIAALRGGATLAGEVAPGPYDMTWGGGGGRRAIAAGGARIDVAANKVTKGRIVLGAAGHVKLACTESTDLAAPTLRHPTPCKATFEGLAATPTPDFGPGHVSGPARSVVTSKDGTVDVPIAPGKYRITLSHGPERSIAQWEQDVPAGIDATMPPAERTTLVRVVDTAGYLAADFHQHTMLGADAPVGTKDRVIANAAEAVEVAVASEHNVVADLEPIVKELGLEAELVELPGNELTTDGSKKPWGHANVYPLTPHPELPRGGATELRDRTAKDVFAELRKIREPHVLQINHPRSGLTGYFDQHHFDARTGEGADAGYDPEFDALEVWNGRNVDARNAVLKDFLVLLRTKHPVTATADTDTHGIVGAEAGYPRTYVRVDDDGPPSNWSPDRSADFVRGVRDRRDVVLTNGPFLKVTANGVGIGGVALGHRVKVVVHVEHAPWMKVERVRIRRSTALAPAEQTIVLKPNARGALVADVSFTVDALTDDAFVVIAEGTQPMTPVLQGDPNEIAPFAMTGAIWIDADGDGNSLGRVSPSPSSPSSPKK